MKYNRRHRRLLQINITYWFFCKRMKVRKAPDSSAKFEKWFKAKFERAESKVQFNGPA